MNLVPWPQSSAEKVETMKMKTLYFGLLAIALQSGCTTSSLPGSRLSFKGAVSETYTFIAVCRATEKPRVSSLGCRATDETFSADQKFEIVEVLKGNVPEKRVVGVMYTFVTSKNSSERPVAKGEQVICVLAVAGGSFDYRASFIMKDTDENRKLARGERAVKD